VKNLAKKVSLVFAAGCFGGLLNSLAVWFFGELGITSALGVKIAPQMSAAWLYPRLIWGGIWGALFLLPLLQKRFWYRGIIFSLGPTIVQLFVVFPYKANKGFMGFDLGLLTPLFVILYNAIWGVAASIWLKWTNR
jgi:ABC-type amino acid transport system permease subunit